MQREYPGIDLDGEVQAVEDAVDPYAVYRMLLLPLENVQQSAVHHPEGDVLYHLLQVFELAREHRPYDEEFLLAALLHDIGKGLDSANHVEAALSAPGRSDHRADGVLHRAPHARPRPTAPARWGTDSNACWRHRQTSTT